MTKQTTMDKLTKLPLIQAPLVGYPRQTRFVVAVSDQGALGVYSTEMLTLEKIREEIQHIKRLTTASFAVMINLSESETSITSEDRKETGTYLAGACKALNIKPSEVPEFPDINEVCKTVVEQRPPVLIFQNGIPTDEFIVHCKKLGIKMLALASNTLEAIAISETEIDGIILQGLESAGPQSNFENDLPITRFPANTLLHHAKQVIDKPLCIWGDTQTPEAAKLQLKNGATSVVLDVPFWTTRESPVPDSYRKALDEHNEMLVTETSVWTGHPANVLHNALTQIAKESKAQALVSGKQQRLMAPIIEAAIKQNNANYLPLWAGLCISVSHGSIAELCQNYSSVLKNTIGRRR